MGDAQRMWLRRVLTGASVAVLLYALYEALPRNPSCPPDARSGVRLRSERADLPPPGAVAAGRSLFGDRPDCGATTLG
jgi:hypothetical protein